MRPRRNELRFKEDLGTLGAGWRWFAICAGDLQSFWPAGCGIAVMYSNLYCRPREQNRTRILPIPAERGIILDRKGGFSSTARTLQYRHQPLRTWSILRKIRSAGTGPGHRS